MFEDGSLKKANAIEIIDEMLDYKKMYQLEQSKLEQKNLEKMTPMIEDSDDAVIKEIDALMGDIAFKTELQAYLKFAFEQEYKMLANFYPNHALLVD